MAATVRKPVKKTTRTKTAPAKKSATHKTARPAAARPRKAAVKAVKKLAPARVPENTNLTRRMVAAAAAACEEKKGFDTRVLELDAADSGFTDFFLITSGANERQTQTIADEVEFRLKRDFHTYPNSVEGKRLGEWILLDYVDFVVHVFLAEKRAFYDIERLRKSARHIDTSELQKKTASARKRVASRTSAAAGTS